MIDTKLIHRGSTIWTNLILHKKSEKREPDSGKLLFWFTYAIMPVGNGINTCIFNENPRESHSLGFSIP